MSMALMKTQLYTTVQLQCLALIINLLAITDAVSTKTGSVIMITIVVMDRMKANSVTRGTNSVQKMNLLVRTSNVLENNSNAMDRMIVAITLMKLGAVSIISYSN